jgi:hypothetical protein
MDAAQSSTVAGSADGLAAALGSALVAADGFAPMADSPAVRGPDAPEHAAVASISATSGAIRKRQRVAARSGLVTGTPTPRC